jgi:chemotaxis family two-component system response regulator Rcp1
MQVLTKPLEILLVEDNEGDIRLVQEGLKSEGMLEHNLHVTDDGAKAISFLKKEGGYKNVPTPNVILLDLNLSQKSGKEILYAVKRDPELRKIPVIVLTSIYTDSEIFETYDMGASSCIIKPINSVNFISTIKILGKLFSYIQLPYFR